MSMAQFSIRAIISFIIPAWHIDSTNKLELRIETITKAWERTSGPAKYEADPTLLTPENCHGQAVLWFV